MAWCVSGFRVFVGFEKFYIFKLWLNIFTQYICIITISTAYLVSFVDNHYCEYHFSALIEYAVVCYRDCAIRNARRGARDLRRSQRRLTSTSTWSSEQAVCEYGRAITDDMPQCSCELVSSNSKGNEYTFKHCIGVL